jgi:hypothetical protein
VGPPLQWHDHWPLRWASQSFAKVSSYSFVLHLCHGVVSVIFFAVPLFSAWPSCRLFEAGGVVPRSQRRRNVFENGERM